MATKITLTQAEDLLAERQRIHEQLVAIEEQMKGVTLAKKQGDVGAQLAIIKLSVDYIDAWEVILRKRAHTKRGEKGPHPCFICVFAHREHCTFKDKAALHSHLVNNHLPTNKVACDDCPFFDIPGNIPRHVASHANTEEGKSKCDKCVISSVNGVHADVHTPEYALVRSIVDNILALKVKANFGFEQMQLILDEFARRHPDSVQEFEKFTAARAAEGVELAPSTPITAAEAAAAAQEPEEEE